MGRSPCCHDPNLKKGPWTPEEDKMLMDYIEKNGCGSWRHLPKLAGLNRCGKSCRLRWTNYLRPDIKRGRFSEDEERLIIQLHSVLGNKWSTIAGRLSGRTDNEIKNYWNTHLRKKLLTMGIDPVTHRPRTDLNLLAGLPNLIAAANLGNMTSSWVNALQLPKLQLLQTLIQGLTNNSTPRVDAMSVLSSSPLLGDHQFGNIPQLHNQFSGHIHSQLNGQACNKPVVWPLLNGSSSTVLGSENVTDSSTLSHIEPVTNSAPSFVSASPENGIVHQVQERVNSSNEVSTSSTTSPPFEAWGGLNSDDLEKDFGWKDILDQIYWSSDAL